MLRIKSFNCVAYSIMKRTHFLNCCAWVCSYYKNKSALCLPHQILDFWYRNSSDCAFSPASNSAWLPVQVCSLHRGGSLYPPAPHRSCRGLLQHCGWNRALLMLNLHLKKCFPSGRDATLNWEAAQGDIVVGLMVIVYCFVFYSEI